MLNVNASASMTILSNFFCKEDSYDKLVFIFYGVFINKHTLAGKNTQLPKETNTKNNVLGSKESEKYTSKGFLILTQKKIKIYYADLIELYLVTPIIDVTDIFQDLENENYVEIVYMNDKNEKEKEKFEITIENKHYFIEKFLENYVYEKTSITNSLIFFNLSEKINFSERIQNGASDPVIGYLLNFKFQNKFNEYNNYIQMLRKITDSLESNNSNNNERPENGLINSAKSNKRFVGKNPNSQTDYERKIFRFKKNWFLIPSMFIKKSNDVLYFPNPDNKEFPIKLIMGSSKTFPIEMLDYDSDIVDIKDIAFEKLLRTIENITGKRNFYLTASKKYIKQNNVGCPQDLGKTVTWILEAKTKIKKNSFHNIILLFIRKSFYPPFYDTFKDYYFFVMEKINLPKNKNLKKLIMHEDIIENVLVGNIRSNKNINQVNINGFEDKGNLAIDNNPRNVNRNTYSNGEIKKINLNSNNFNLAEDKSASSNIKGDQNNENKSASKRSKSNQYSAGDNKIENCSVETYERDGKIYKKIIKKKVLFKKNENEISDRNSGNKDVNNKSFNDVNNNNNYNRSLNNSNIQNPNETFNDGTRKTKTIIVKKKVKVPKGASLDARSKEISLRNSVNTNNLIVNNTNNKSHNKSDLKVNNNNKENENQVSNLVTNKFKTIGKASAQIAWNGEISKFARSIVTDIAETFNSMLTFHTDYLEKMKTLSLIRLETFSCFKSFYENSFQDFSESVKFNNIKSLKRIGIDLLYKILLILKESSYDQISDDLNIVENIIKISNTDDHDYLFIHREKMKKIDFAKILEQNDEFLDSIFRNYYVKTEDDLKNPPKEKKQTKSKAEFLDNLVLDGPGTNHSFKDGISTRKFLTDNRNDFIVYCLNGKLVENLTLDLTKILKFSLRKETIKSIIKSLIFPLLNLSSALESDTKSNKDLMNEICESNENSRLHITFNEDVLCAMIESDFFRKAEMINLISSYERFLIFILEKHGSNKVFASLYRFLKQEKRNSVNYDLMVQKNFNKNSYLENFYKKVESEYKIPEIPNNSDFDRSFLSKTNLFYNEKLSPEATTKGPYSSTKKPETPVPDFNKTKKTKNALDNNLKNSIAEIKVKFEKELDSYSIINSDELLKEKNNTINQLSHKFCLILFKFYSSSYSNLNKILTSCKCLILLCKENSSNRKRLIEQGIFEVIFRHLLKFNEEKTLTASLQLMYCLLDHNDITVINYLKTNDKWDDYLGNIISVILNWKYQSIKCSTKLVTVLVEIFISISNFNFDLTKLFTVGYENSEKYIYNLNEIGMTMINYSNNNNMKNNTSNLNNKNNNFKSNNQREAEKRSKLFIFIERLLDESYINKAFTDPQNSHSIYEKTLIFLCKIYDNNKNSEWMKNLLKAIEKKFDLVLGSFKSYYNKTKSTTNLKDDFGDLDDSDEAKNFIYYCKIFFITLNFYETTEAIDDTISANTPYAKVLKFLNDVKMHKDFNFIWEKSKAYIEILDNPNGDDFQHDEEELDNVDG